MQLSAHAAQAGLQAGRAVVEQHLDLRVADAEAVRIADGGGEQAQPLVHRQGRVNARLADVGERAGGCGLEVMVENKPIDLTPKEYELLIYFKNNRAIALSRESILNAVWGYDYFGDLRTVDTHVKKLRAKLGECGTMIETVRGYGYRFEV